LVARPNREWPVIPYVSLGAGFFSTRLGTNPNPESAVVTQTVNGMGIGLAAGGGVEFRLQGRLEAVLDWRYHQGLYNTRGSNFMPLSVGLRW
jgi:opacity protein-like surface antigen